MKAVVIGASSSVGHGLVERLASDEAWSSVCIVVRKETADFANIPGHSKIVARRLPDLDDLSTLAPELKEAGYDAMFCALGAYMKLDGPEAVQKVDYTYVVAAASLAEECGIASFSLVSAAGADADLPETVTKFKLYLRTKGLADRAVLEKDIPRIFIYRPGVLFGRHSSQASASTRSKGSWDTMVDAFACGCRCLTKAAGVHIKDLAEVMVVQVEEEAYVMKTLPESRDVPKKATITNDEINRRSSGPATSS